MQTIGYEAFSYCDSLEKAQIAIGEEQTYFTTIANKAFYSCPKLKEVLVSDFVKSIGEQTFAECKALNLITLGKNLESIGYRAFYNCTALDNITLTADLMNLGKEAFRGCTALAFVNYEGTLAQWELVTKNSNWFRDIPATTVHCSDGEAAIA